MQVKDKHKKYKEVEGPDFVVRLYDPADLFEVVGEGVWTNPDGVVHMLWTSAIELAKAIQAIEADRERLTKKTKEA